MSSDFYLYLPETAIAKCAVLVAGHKVVIHVVRDRKTKHGDFRVQPKKPVLITINAMENPYRFLLTFLHEWAHYNVFSSFTFRKKPHGKEWKSAFQQMVAPFLEGDIFPESLLIPLKHHMQNAKATFAADANLTMALREFDPPNNKKCIFELEQGTLFNAQDGRVFSKDAKRRTRFVCTCVKTKKQYLFPPFVEVSPI
jgi:hypothetical protein